MHNITPTSLTAVNETQHLGSPAFKVLRCGTLRAAARAFFAICSVATLVLSDYAWGQDSVPVETMLIAEVLQKVESADGRPSQRLVPAQVINQGDVVFYTVRIRNPGSSPARDVAVVQRIPANTAYVQSSASGPSVEITFSVDGGNTFLPPKELVVSIGNASRAATPADYTHIRWQLRNALAAGAVAYVRFQAVFR